MMMMVMTVVEAKIWRMKRNTLLIEGLEGLVDVNRQVALKVKAF